MDYQTFHNIYKGKLPNEAYHVTMKGVQLTEGIDYIVKYKNTGDIGKAALVIEGIHDYKGSKNTIFKLTGKKFTKGTILIEGITDQFYTGEAVIQENIKISYIDSSKQTIELRLNKDYIITYDNNIRKGKAKICITAMPGSGYQGTVKKTFYIYSKEMKLTSWMFFEPI